MSRADAWIRRETVTGLCSSAAIALLYLLASRPRPRSAGVLPSLRRAGRPNLIAPQLPAAAAGKRHAGQHQGDAREHRNGDGLTQGHRP